jgi:hypothetical protein
LPRVVLAGEELAPAFARQRQPVADPQQREVDALVAEQIAVERLQGARVVVARRLRDAAAPEHVVDRDRERAVAGEDADLDRLPGAAHQQRRQLALFGADLHAGVRPRTGRLAQRLLRRTFARRMLVHTHLFVTLGGDWGGHAHRSGR